MAQQHRVSDYMTVEPRWIDVGHHLGVAARQMRELHIGHLPVLRGKSLVGMLSLRDVALVKALELEPKEVTVEEVMAEPLTLASDMPLARAARSMAIHKHGCAIVMEGADIRGILTLTDALNALADLLDEHDPTHQDMLPSQVRNAILSEHVSIRALLDRSEAHAKRILSGRGYDADDVLTLRGIVHQLSTGVCRHMELENRVLAPALAEIDAFGEVRAQRLLTEHAHQKDMLEHLVERFDNPSVAQPALAAELVEVIAALRLDMHVEEETLLNPRLLRDDLIALDAEAG